MSVAVHLVRILLLQVTLKTCLAGIVMKLPKLKDPYGLIEPTIRTLKSCHECPENGIHVVGGPLDVLSSSLMSEPSTPAVIINDTRPRVDSAPGTSLKSHKLRIFLIMASSSSKLLENLAGLKKLPWWNHMADFWLVEWPVQENDCTNAYAFLWTAWRMNILEAKFICVHGTRGKLIYGFNPYTRYAPDPWRLEKVYTGDNKHDWSLLSRELSSAFEPCRNMSFDKTEDLGGHEIRITISKYWRFLPNKTGIDAMECPACSGFRAIIHSLNATAKLLVHEAKEMVGSVNVTGNIDSEPDATHYGISDIALQINGDVGSPKWCKLRPHFISETVIITQYRGYASQVEKIVSLVDVTSRAGILFVCLLTFIFFKYVVRQTSGIASLTVVRIICNSCLIKLPSTTSSRIYLGSLFFFVVTFQGIYQGAIASLLAKRVLLRNIDNLEDLRETDHTIYGHHELGVLLSEPEFQGRFVGLEIHNCTEYVLQNSINACLMTRGILQVEAGWVKLHVSKTPIAEHSLAFPMREDWPLEWKFNQKLQALVEAGVFRYAFDINLDKILKSIEANDNEDRDKSFKTLNTDDLRFAFVILAIGLTMAAITFVLEVIRG